MRVRKDTVIFFMMAVIALVITFAAYLFGGIDFENSIPITTVEQSEISLDATDSVDMYTGSSW